MATRTQKPSNYLSKEVYDPLSAVDSLLWREGTFEFTNYQWLMKSSFGHMKNGIYVNVALKN